MEIAYAPVPTAKLFHADDNFIRALKGPVGSGKSVCCIMEVLKLAMAQRPFNGIRKTRCAIIRATYPMLKTTTIKTAIQWLPQELMQVTYGSPITGKIKCTLPDGTILDSEIFFLAVDRPADVEKLKSLELSFAWINEAGETNKRILDVLKGRVGRYPQAMQGGCTRKCVFMDTNPPPIRSWFYNLFELERPEGHAIYHQPSPLIYDPATSTYYPNPDAENIAGHIPDGGTYIDGYSYYLDQIPGTSPDIIQTLIMGQYGAVYDGRAVYPSFDDRMQVYGTPLVLDQQLPVVAGFDFGLMPAVVFTQMDDYGQLRVIDELIGEDVMLDDFLDTAVLPLVRRKYGNVPLTFVGDPTGRNRSSLRSSHAYQVMKERGLPIKAAHSNFIPVRIRAVEYFLHRREGLLVSPTCPMIREGFKGGYRYVKETAAELVKVPQPDKNEYSHPHDALQYAALYHYRMFMKHRRQGQASGPGSNQQHKYA